MWWSDGGSAPPHWLRFLHFSALEELLVELLEAADDRVTFRG
ncbi:hypothetical protein HNR71_002415 [Kribbella sandramycini]|uniref:Uncharacterized protein n=1 Tax=Kribbella sandramycini TaxID=60450 RepID=A0A841S3P1_9ACTN|nr:hypothetical protein [Kribbella sandramycini]